MRTGVQRSHRDIERLVSQTEVCGVVRKSAHFGPMAGGRSVELETARPEVEPRAPVESAAGPVAPGRLTRADVLRLQRSAGNAAVSRLMRQASEPAPAGAAVAEPPAAPEE